MALNRPLRVLHIDDSSLLRKSVHRGLEPYLDHYELTQVASADEALALLTSEKQFDVILTDWLMAGKSGLDLLCALKSHPTFHRLPVFFLTSEYDSNSLVIAVTHGASGILKKPVTGPEIHTYLQKKLNHIEESLSSSADTFFTDAKPLLKELRTLLSLNGPQDLNFCLHCIQNLKLKATAAKWPLLADYSQRVEDITQITLKNNVQMLTPLSRILTEFHSFMEKGLASLEIGRPHPLISDQIDKSLKSYITNLEAGWFTPTVTAPTVEGAFIPQAIISELQQYLSPEGTALLEPYLKTQKTAT